MSKNPKNVKAELVILQGARAVKDGLVLQLLVGITQEMGRDKREHMMEVRADNNMWGMTEGWYSVMDILKWVAREMLHN
jgi:hypothetical protein